MLCQNCNQNEANVSYTEIINGVKKQIHLCEKCARDANLENMFHFSLPISTSSFLSDMFEDFEENFMLPQITKEVVCDNCKTNYQDFINSGMLGCPYCYEVFHTKLDPILKTIHGNNKHIGKRLENAVDNKEERKLDQKEEHIFELKNQLKEMIRVENYEEAAKIRDEIKKWEEGK